ncbi:MAG: tetratricopeptide repeat protein, partial [Polyangia bacterium]|nr:tetratricopeptide repeat protein [Polyangia bacterium]
MRRLLPVLLVAGIGGPAFGQGRTGESGQAAEAVRKADEAFTEKRMKEAIRLYRQALGYDRTLSAAHEKLAVALYALRRYSEGVGQASECLKALPEHAPCHMWMGLHKIRMKKVEEGIKHLEDAIKRNWKLAPAMNELGRYYFRRGDWKRAERAFWAFLNHRDQSWPAAVDKPVLTFLGKTYLATKRYSEAQSRFAAALKIDPRDVEAKLGLADAYRGRGFWNDALNIYLSLKPQWARRLEIHFKLAQCFYRLRRKGKALEHLAIYRAKRPRDAEATLLLGDIHFFFREFTPALAAYKRAVEQSPGSMTAQIKYAEALLQNKEPQKAYDALRAAQRRAPSHPGLLAAMANALLQLKRPAEALPILDKLLTSQPSLAQAYVLRGEAHLAQNSLPKATEDFKRARELDPKDFRAKKGYILVLNQTAFGLLTEGKADRAIASLSEAHSLDPQLVFTSVNLGIAYLQVKNHKEALRHLTAVHQRLPNSFTANRLLARLYYDTGQLKVARGHYTQARAASRRLTSNAQAEVEIELGGLLAAEGEIDAAVDVLKSAVANSVGSKELAPVAQSNLAIALLDRGYRHLDGGKGTEALADLELAQQHESHLKDNQPALLRFLLAMAYLETGNWAKAGAAFAKVSDRKVLSEVLNPPYDRLGVKYFQAYTLYRQGGYEAAAKAIGGLMRGAPEEVKGRLREILRSSNEHRATQLMGRGDHKGAQRLFAQAATMGANKQAQHNHAVSLYRSGKQAEALAIWQAAGMPAPALCNVGTITTTPG